MMPSELKQKIAQMRLKDPQLARLPEKQIAKMLLETMAQQVKPLTIDENLRKMCPEELRVIGERLMKDGHLNDAEK